MHQLSKFEVSRSYGCRDNTHFVKTVLPPFHPLRGGIFKNPSLVRSISSKYIFPPNFKFLGLIVWPRRWSFHFPKLKN